MSVKCSDFSTIHSADEVVFVLLLQLLHPLKDRKTYSYMYINQVLEIFILSLHVYKTFFTHILNKTHFIMACQKFVL